MKKQLTNLELENSVLNTLMTFPQEIYNVIDFLSEDIFTTNFNKMFVTAMISAKQKGHSVDASSINNENNELSIVDIAKMAVNSEVFFTGISEKVKILYELYMLREIALLGHEVSVRSQEVNSDPFELNEYIGLKLLKIMPARTSQNELLRDYMPRHTKILQEANNAEIKSGTNSGLKAVDSHMNGFRKGNLVIVAARPSVGKTAFALKIVSDIIFNQKEPTGIFSMEMSKEELTNRVISSETGIPLSKIINGQMDDDDWSRYNVVYEIICERSGNFCINDTAGMNIYGVKAAAIAMKNRYNIKLLVVDYLQLISGQSNVKNVHNKNREQEVSLIARELKILAKTLEIPIVCLSQLNRAVESRSEPKPKLSDLRESGSIEQDADCVLFLYRPNQQTSDPIDKINIYCAKNRQGHLFEEELNYVKDIVKFTDQIQFGHSADKEPVADYSISKRSGEFVDDAPF